MTTPHDAAQHLINTLRDAVNDPNVPTETVQAAAQHAHNTIEAHGGDYNAAFKQTT
ncbi:hypothetical protein [Streptomyces sp. NPDC058657]|uniref:hypothetical protein n=1 Tax=unclassified Streptomyces TaxID=2593676 RepID=UPI00365D94DB